MFEGLKKLCNDVNEKRSIVKHWENETNQSAAKQPIHCPKCYSEQISTDKNGFSATKAIVGTLAVPGLGLLAGCHGKNKVNITCLKCGHSWKP